MYTADMRM